MDVDSEITRPLVYTASRGRFLTLGLYCSVAFLMSGTWLSFAPVIGIAAERFDVSLEAVDQFGLVTLYLYIPASILVLLRACLCVGSVSNTIAILVRFVALSTPGVSPHAAFAITMVSQLLAALTQPMVLNLAARVASDWFPVWWFPPPLLPFPASPLHHSSLFAWPYK